MEKNRYRSLLLFPSHCSIFLLPLSLSHIHYAQSFPSSLHPNNPASSFYVIYFILPLISLWPLYVFLSTHLPSVSTCFILLPSTLLHIRPDFSDAHLLLLFFLLLLTTLIILLYLPSSAISPACPLSTCCQGSRQWWARCSPTSMPSTPTPPPPLTSLLRPDLQPPTSG